MSKRTWRDIKKESYPENLIKDILAPDAGISGELSINEDMVKGLEYALSQLSEKEQALLKMRYQAKFNYKQIAENYPISAYSAENVIRRAVRRLGGYKTIKYIRYGLEFTRLSDKEEEERQKRISNPKSETELRNILIEDLDGISVKTYISLQNKNINTIGEILNFIESGGPEWYKKIPKFGIMSLKEVDSLLTWYKRESERFKM